MTSTRFWKPDARMLGLRLAIALAMAAFAGNGWAHGFNFTLNYSSGVPSSFSVESEDTIGPDNLFVGQFSTTTSSDADGTYYFVNHGFVDNGGDAPWPTYTATFKILSPLYFSNGVDPVVPAAANTLLKFTDRFPNDVFGGYPLAGSSTDYVKLYGTGPDSHGDGFAGSLADPHELSHKLYLPDYAQQYGEFGFAYQVTVAFDGGPTLTSEPLVNVFAMSDPGHGGFATNASQETQDAATDAIFGAAIEAAESSAVPEPATLAIAVIGTAFAVPLFWRSRRKSAS